MKARHDITLLLLSLLLAWVPARAQVEGLVAPVYGWHAYTSHSSVREISVMGDSAYAITAGGLILHDLITSENTVYTTVEGLSSTDPTAVLADPATRRVFVGFRDGMLNYLDAEGGMRTVTDIERNEQFTYKKINHFYAREGLLYIATDFGLVVYDIDAGETRYSVSKVGTNPTGSLVSSVTVAQGRIWICMEGRRMWSAQLDADGPRLPTDWRLESGTDGLPLGSTTYVCADKELLFAQVLDTIFQRWPGEPWEHAAFPPADWHYLNSANGNVYGTFRRTGAMVLYPDSNLVSFDNQGKIMCNAITRYGNMVLGDSLGGLQLVEFGIGFREIGPGCPKNNFVEDMAAHDGELYIAAKGRIGSSARAYDKSGVPFFDLHHGGWKVIDHRDGTLGDVYQDFYRVVLDTVTGRCFVGSWGEGLVELLHGEFVRDYTPANSGLLGSSAGVLIAGLQFDEFGNLWIAHGLSNTPLQCLTPDGQWYSYTAPFNVYAIGLTLDALGNKWITNNGAGLAVFNDNYTPDDPSDDRWQAITTTLGRGNLPNNTVYTVAQDHDLQIWIGTSEGVTIVYDPTLLWTDDFQDAACPLIEGYCLFRDQQVNDIVVDGYNRKWIATENGVFLVNLDGTAVLEHFTEANSPLLDDEVHSIAVDGLTGEVFFGTAKGVVSYIGDATDGQADAEALFAYPNPAFMDQDHPLMIRGMRAFSKVKIATAAGRLVRELDSNGGSVTWDYHDAWGNRVTPGIYLIMVSDPDGNGAGITKIALLETQK